MSGWIGFNTAVSGLLASQRSLYTTNHNISNANTAGYSRQIATQTTRNPHALPGIGMLGTGTDITSINRVRSTYIDRKYWGENSPLGEWEVKRDTLVEIERLFNEPSDSSIRKNLDEFFDALETLSTNPSSYAHRALVKEKADAVTKYLNETSQKFFDVQKELNFQVATKVSQVNDYAEQIRNLNQQIYSIELDGTHANDLRDKRDLLVDQLSKIVNIQTSEENDKFRILIGGITLVDHIDANKLIATPMEGENKLNPKETLYDVKWESTGQKLNLRGGELKGLLEMRDGTGEGGEYKGVPFYITRLNEFAQGMFETLNAVHFQGHGLNGSEKMFLFSINEKNTSKLGLDTNALDLSDRNSKGYEKYQEFIKDNVTAANISLSGDILDSLDNIAAGLSQNKGVEDNTNILKLITLRENKNFFSDPGKPQGTPEDFLKSILSTLAVDSQQALRMTDNQSAIVENIAMRRMSESGVSIDEEMSNMVRFQHTYNASARMITTLDQIMEVTINRLGLVGR